jgi:hypothetical protein
MNIIDRQTTINLTSTPEGYRFIHQGKDYKFPTLEKVHEFFFTETKLDTVKLCHQGKKSYVHFSIDEIETFTSKKALRRILSQESEGAWIEKRDGKKKYFVDNGWLFSSIKKVSKEEYQNRPEEGSAFQKVLGVALGIFAITPAAVECARRMPVGTQEAAMGLIAMQHRSPLLAVLGYSLLPHAAKAQAVGTEFQVNTNVTNDQENPSIAALKNGGFVIVWQSSGQDGSGNGIFGQIYDVNGIQIGLEFQINNNTLYDQQHPKVASLDDGGFIVVWESLVQNSDIYAQRFDANGTRNGTEFQVNNYTINIQDSPSIAVLQDRGAVVCWKSNGQDGDNDGIFGQRYDPNFSRIDIEFQVNNYTISGQINPYVAALKDNGFIVVWASAGQDGNSYGVYSQRYNATGLPIRSEFRINTNTINDQSGPRIAALIDGGFIAAWSSFQNGLDYDIYGQRYNIMGLPVGSEFLVNTNTTNSKLVEAIATLNDGGFVVTWISIGQDGDGYGIYAQRYDANCIRNGTEFKVNNYIISHQASSSVASLKDGGFVIVWVSFGQDGDLKGIFGQRYDANGTPIPLIIAPSSSTSNTPTSSFSASITSPSGANSQSSNPIPSITAIATSILSTPSEASSNQMGSLPSTNPQQTPSSLPGSSSQTPTPIVPSSASQFSPSINPISQTPSPISSPTPPFPAPSVLLTYNPDSSSNPASSSEVICGQDCETSNTRLIGGLLGGIVGIVTIAGGVFAVYKWKNRKKDISDDSEKGTHSDSVKMESISPSASTSVEERGIQDTYVPSVRLDGFDPLPEELKQSHPAATFKVGDFPSIAEVSFKEVEQRGGRIIESEKGNQYKLLDSITRKEELSILQVTAAEVQFVKPKERSSPYLGKGQHGVVRIAQDIKTNKYVAVKEIRNTPEVPNAIEISAREGEILQQLEGVPNIIPLYGEYYVKSEMVLYQFMYLAGFGDGSLLAQKLRNQSKRVKNAILVEAAKELLQGVIGMQERHIYHFDLKPSNFMFDKVGTLYIVDFGSAIELEKGVLNEYVYADAYYFSPERIELSRTEYNNRTTGIIQPIDPISAEKSEGWSLGVSLLEMINGHNSFIGKDPVLERDEDFFKRILQKELKQIDAPDEIAVIIRGLLITDPSERMSVLEAYGKIQNISLFKDPEEKARVFASMKGLEQE